jgi:hypothetical protein
MTERSPITQFTAGNLCVGLVFGRAREGDQSPERFPNKSAAIAAPAKVGPARNLYTKRNCPVSGKELPGCVGAQTRQRKSTHAPYKPAPVPPQ